MTAGYLLDANLLIGAFDPSPDNLEHKASQDRLRKLLSDPDVRLAITPLVRYEVLRGVRNRPVEAVKRALDQFQELEVKRDDAELAARVFAQAVANGNTFDKRKFDVFHCVAAHHNQLEVTSRDGDIPKIMEVLKQVSA